MNETRDLHTVGDYLRWITTQFAGAGLHYGHGTDNPWDEAAALLCGALGLPWDRLDHVLGSRLLDAECRELERLVARRVDDRVPVPYLVGEAWFGGHRFEVETGVLIPRSPIAELIRSDFIQPPNGPGAQLRRGR